MLCVYIVWLLYYVRIVDVCYLLLGVRFWLLVVGCCVLSACCNRVLFAGGCSFRRCMMFVFVVVCCRCVSFVVLLFVV